MKWYVDSIFRKLGERIIEIENELLLAEDEEYSAARYAKQGAIIVHACPSSVASCVERFVAVITI